MVINKQALMLSICVIMIITCFFPWLSVPPIFIPSMSIVDIIGGAVSKNGTPTNYGMLLTAFLVIPGLNIIMLIRSVLKSDTRYWKTIYAFSILSAIASVPFALMLFGGPIVYLAGSIVLIYLCNNTIAQTTNNQAEKI